MRPLSTRPRLVPMDFFFLKAPMDSPRAAAMYYVDHVSAGSSCFKLHNTIGNKVEPIKIKKSSPNWWVWPRPLTVAHMLLQYCMTEANMNPLFFLPGSSIVSGWYYSTFFIHSSQCMLLGTRGYYPLPTSYCGCPWKREEGGARASVGSTSSV